MDPDLKVAGRSNGVPLYTEQKMVAGDLEGGFKVKDKVMEADGSFTGISGEHDEVVEIGAQGDVTEDFNPTTAELETPKESFKDLIRAERDPNTDIKDLPATLSEIDNPEMTVLVIDEDGRVVGEEFTVREAYQEVNNGN